MPSGRRNAAAVECAGDCAHHPVLCSGCSASSCSWPLDSPQQELPTRQAAWYAKSAPTFADALSACPASALDRSELATGPLRPHRWAIPSALVLELLIDDGMLCCLIGAKEPKSSQSWGQSRSLISMNERVALTGPRPSVHQRHHGPPTQSAWDNTCVGCTPASTIVHRIAAIFVPLPHLGRQRFVF